MKKNKLKFSMEIDLKKDKEDFLKTKIFFKNLNNLEINRSSTLNCSLDKIKENEFNLNKFDIDKELKYYQDIKKIDKFERPSKNLKYKTNSKDKSDYPDSNLTKRNTIKNKLYLNKDANLNQEAQNKIFHRTIKNNEKSYDSRSNEQEGEYEESQSLISFNDSYDEISLNNIRMRRKQRQDKAKEFNNS